MASEDGTVDFVGRAADADGSGGAVYVRVYRRKAGKKSFLDRLTLQDTDDLLEAIRERWGGGDYALQPVNLKNQVQAGGGDVSIAGRPKDDEPDEPEEPAPARTVRHDVYAPEPASDFAQMGAMLREIRDELRRPPPAAAAADPMTMAASIVQTIQAATAPLTAKLLELSSTPREDSSGTVLKAFVAGLQAAANMERPDSGAPSYIDRLINEVAIPLVRRIQSDDDATAARPGAPLAAADPDAEGEDVTWQALVAANMDGLIKLAGEGKSALLYAQLLAQEMPDEYLDTLLDAVDGGEPFWAEFFARWPRAREHDAWFRSFVGQLWHDGNLADDEAPNRAQA